MRKLLSILLLGLFGLPMIAPALVLGQSSESRLPSCCRKGGDHHCAGGMSEMASPDGRIAPNPTLRILISPCPYSPGALNTAHLNLIAAPTHAVSLSLPLAQHVLTSRNAFMRCIERDRSRPDRGPPASSLA